MIDFHFIFLCRREAATGRGEAIVEAFDEETARRALVAEALSRNMVLQVIERRSQIADDSSQFLGDV